MPLKSSTSRYGAIAASIHWLSAIAVILMLVSGLVMGNEDDLVPRLLPFHVALGVVVGLLTLFRVVWWWLFDKHPQPVAGTSRMQEWAARLVHLGLYVAILVMVASGVATVALTGAAPAIFGGGPLPEFDDVAPYDMHELMSRLLIVLALGHIGAALFHQFIKRDGLIGRMRVGSR
ncbi:cytochrome b561 [Devosia lucknowensis]|uniref:Cytochrome b561 n=1 Tax=Devosia lucknowensis TaxID=1096929 RepID=A0A1Y6G7B7_9HYPH|nr:cytochrome b/b6 domain-containing protein [Devosia lucknowensis]SMQ86051.1 cytochrome b561 [Devosia lucknowensis]